jgi:hypothetical protein
MEETVSKTDDLAPIRQLSRTITVLIEKGNKAAGKAEQFYKAAGLHLKTLKERMPNGETWEQFVKDKCGVSYQRAYELICLADGKITLAEMRERGRERVSQHRKNEALLRNRNLPYRPDVATREEEPTESGDDDDAEPTNPPDVIQGASDEDHWAATIAKYAGEILALRAYWRRQFGQWERFSVSSELVELAEQAVNEWKEIKRDLKARLKAPIA